jgi:hypothetical protein
MGEKALIGSSYWLLACNRLTVDDENSVRLIQRHERIDIACVECVQKKNVDVGRVVSVH